MVTNGNGFCDSWCGLSLFCDLTCVFCFLCFLGERRTHFLRFRVNRFTFRGLWPSVFDPYVDNRFAAKNGEEMLTKVRFTRMSLLAGPSGCNVIRIVVCDLKGKCAQFLFRPLSLFLSSLVITININICSIELKWDGKITKIWYNNEMRGIRIMVWNGGDL